MLFLIACVDSSIIRKDSIPQYLKIPAFFIWGKMEESQAEKETADFLLKKGWDVTVKVHDGGHYIPDGSINEVLDWFQSK